MHSFFEGYYFKIVKNQETLCFIVGYCLGEDSHSFIQVLGSSLSKAYYFRYDVLACTLMREPLYIRIGDNIFTKNKISVNLKQADFELCGKVTFKNHKPLVTSLYTPSIMGPLYYVFASCVHTLVSLHHHVEGTFLLNKQSIDFTQGLGYIEGDKGNSFPKSYLWLQALDSQFSIFLAIALVESIVTFKGFIAVIQHQQKQYRLASYYLGRVKLQEIPSGKLIRIKQGVFTLLMVLRYDEKGFMLASPKEGNMNETIEECLKAHLSLALYKNGECILAYRNLLCSMEIVKADLL